jgi:hypothetical protein
VLWVFSAASLLVNNDDYDTGITILDIPFEKFEELS